MDTTTTQQSLGTSTTPPGFAAFKAEEKVSFIRRYDPKAPALPGYTNQIIRYRDTSKGTAIKPAMMATVPQIELPSLVTVLDDAGIAVGTSGYFLPKEASEVLINALEDAVNDIIRAAIENKQTTIAWDQVSVDKALAFLTAARVNNRLTREAVEAWVKVALADACKDRATEVATSKGFQNDEAKLALQIEGTTKAYADNFGKLSAAVPNVGQETAISLQVMLERADVEDDISKALKKKLHAILNPVAANNGDL